MLDPIILFIQRIFSAIGRGIGIVIAWILFPFLSASRWYASRGLIIKAVVGLILVLLVVVFAHFIWITGNHDPHPPAWLGGTVMPEWREGGLIFRHEPRADAGRGEVAGHLHPAASVAKYGRGVRRRCFVADAARLLLPSFGAYTGGLDVGDPAIAGLFGSRFHAFMLGAERVYAIPRTQVERRKRSEEIQPMITAIATAARP